MPSTPPPQHRRKSPEELLRERVNEMAVTVIAEGFAAIDALAEQGKSYIKREIIRAVSPPRKRKK